MGVASWGAPRRVPTDGRQPPAGAAGCAPAWQARAPPSCSWVVGWCSRRRRALLLLWWTTPAASTHPTTRALRASASAPQMHGVARCDTASRAPALGRAVAWALEPPLAPLWGTLAGPLVPPQTATTRRTGRRPAGGDARHPPPRRSTAGAPIRRGRLEHRRCGIRLARSPTRPPRPAARVRAGVPWRLYRVGQRARWRVVAFPDASECIVYSLLASRPAAIACLTASSHAVCMRLHTGVPTPTPSLAPGAGHHLHCICTLTRPPFPPPTDRAAVPALPPAGRDYSSPSPIVRAR